MAHPGPQATRDAIEAEYHAISSPFRTAEVFSILDVIDPRETRGVLCDWVEDAWAVIEGDRGARPR